MRGYAYLSGVATLEFDPEACIGCGKCAEVCPHQVFAMSDERARLVERDRCMECGACRMNCPAGAIRVDAGVGCASGMINEWLGEVLPGRFSGSGGCC